eukprot:TRINITY_DN3078_c0_g3_i3.p1 TRINITY_DN3078_c0_g3~~TRINITY_DN3078_c0_g3_i3.p1  ORF type:complete len:207 (-),score=-16.21 TRINITY_DN3078_c0_g3_i3:152-772(-)
MISLFQLKFSVFCSKQHRNFEYNLIQLKRIIYLRTLYQRLLKKLDSHYSPALTRKFQLNYQFTFQTPLVQKQTRLYLDQPNTCIFGQQQSYLNVSKNLYNTHIINVYLLSQQIFQFLHNFEYVQYPYDVQGNPGYINKNTMVYNWVSANFFVSQSFARGDTKALESPPKISGRVNGSLLLIFRELSSQCETLLPFQFYRIFTKTKL